MIQFDYPLNERMRTFLRLETLFYRLFSCVDTPTPVSIQSAISDIINILHIFTCRVDLKAELIKELERHHSLLHQLQNNPDADHNKLTALQQTIQPLLEALHHSNTPPGYELKNNEFIKSIMQRSGIPGGTCNFDLPGYHMWLHQPLQTQQSDLQKWCHSFVTASDSILLILDSIRNSVIPQEKTAEKGFMQLNLNKDLPYQMLHIKVDEQLKVYPEISGNKRRCIIRFMDFSTEERPRQTKQGILFQLTCCQI